MTRHELKKEKYHTWLCNLVYDFGTRTSYDILLRCLNETPFRYSIPMDENREMDGLALRGRFESETGIEFTDESPCSVLEMLVALAIRMEHFMEDEDYGDRTGQWFWMMIVNLGLGHFSDDRFDYDAFIDIIDRFLDREYEYDGEGGLFQVNDPDEDMRDLEIWWQMMWGLNEVIEEER